MLPLSAILWSYPKRCMTVLRVFRGTDLTTRRGDKALGLQAFGKATHGSLVLDISIGMPPGAKPTAQLRSRAIMYNPMPAPCIAIRMKLHG